MQHSSVSVLPIPRGAMGTSELSTLRMGELRMTGERATLYRGLLGGAIAVVLHLKNGWWLDAGDRIVEMLIVLGLAAVIVGLWRDGKTPAYLRVAGLWVGFVIASSLVLFTIGPGNIFPIVLIGIAVLSFGAVLAGAIIGVLRETLGH